MISQMNIPTIFYPGRVFLLIGMLYCHPVWHILCHSEMVSHVPSFRQAGRLLLSCSPTDDFLLCCHRLAVAIRTVPRRFRNMVFRTKLWHSLLSRMLCHALPPLFPYGKDVAKGVVHLLFPHPFPAARRFVHHCGFPCGGDSSALQTAMGMCRRRHEHPAVHTYDKSRQMTHQEG